MRHISLTRACALVPVLAVVMAGCNQRPNPIEPPPAAAAGSLATAAQLSPDDLTNRGWTCFTPPVPNRIVCSHPNQGFPVVGNPPPADRPATYQFFLFDGAGNFVGPEFLIRTDLYKGQICEATGEPYVFVPIIGYYECVHPAARG